MDNKTNKMLIDATHPEETRVVVLRNGRVEEFDYESAARKLLRGNIYLAKVTRVEPSLQAAFVEYGGNRHGFLAFNEIHPDYYQIPMADRQALIEEEAQAEAEADAEADARAERRFRGGPRRDGGRDGGRNGNRNGGQADSPGGSHEAGSEPHHQPQDDQPRDVGHADDGGHDAPGSGGHQPADHAHAEHPAGTASSTQSEHTGHDDPRLTEAYVPHDQAAGSTPHVHGDAAAAQDHAGHDSPHHDHGGHDAPARHAHESDRSSAANIEEVPEVNDAPETIGAGSDAVAEDDGVEDVQERPRRQRRRQYKIQEVIKRRQVILVQVVKEERGNKGAALTTYLSLAGRYTVLMPNTGRGGGISRKIVNAGDRKRLKAIAQELDVPEGMGLIIRTAGAARTSQEIKRDYEYLLRLWESVREMTLQSTAPSLVYEEGNLIKRSIRDLYTKEIDEVVVAGDQAYSDAHDFMRMLMPSHAKNVIKYAQPEALFTRYPIERQLNAMFSPYVTLRSGGYLVINQTEALVSIDVNSGKSTREYSIEETALATNLEASDEIARQLKLRDLAGLIVIDFIDMEEKRNNRAVERRLKDALQFDRARIQVGRISHFGLMEMSRQRMRTGVLEGSTSQCPHCQGTGMIRSTESVALAVLRGLEDHLVKEPRASVNVLTTAQVALYILNNKRSFITEIERRYGIAVAVQASDRMQGANFAIERSAAPVQAPRAADRTAVSMDWGFDGEDAGEAGGSGNVEMIEDVHANGSDRGHGHHDHSHRDDARGERGGGDHEDASEVREGGGQDGDRPGRRRRRRRGRDRGERPHQPGSNGQGHDQQADGQRGGNGPRRDDRHDRPQTVAHAPEAGEHVDVDSSDGHDDVEEIGRSPNPGEPDARPAGQGDEGDRGARRGRRRGRRGGRRGGRDNRDGTPAEGGPSAEAGGALLTGGDEHPMSHDGNAPHDTHSASAEQHGDQTAAFADDTHRARAEPAPYRQPEPVHEHRTASVPEPHRDEAPVHHQPAAVSMPASVPAVSQAPAQVAPLPEAPDDPTKPRRRGWWQRRGLGE